MDSLPYSEKKYALLWKLGVNDAETDKTRKTETAIVFIITSFVAVCIGAITTIGLIKYRFRTGINLHNDMAED